MTSRGHKTVRWQKVYEGCDLSDSWEAFCVDRHADLASITTELLSDSGASATDNIRLLCDGGWYRLSQVTSLPVGDIKGKIVVHKKGAQLSTQIIRSPICKHHVMFAQ